MKRPAHAENTLQRLKDWRSICPDLTLRSTFIVGFPGETEAEFQELLDWMDEAQLDRVGCFTYSAVDGASANALPDAIPEAVKEERYQRFMEHAQKISRDKLAEKVGKTFKVIVDDIDAEAGIAMARGPGDAPEIDGNIFIESPGADQLVVGNFVHVSITEADDYDLYAQAIAE